MFLLSESGPCIGTLNRCLYLSFGLFVCLLNSCVGVTRLVRVINCKVM
uniref:Uncharacterized protein n=1 Tax=Arundo donax TaxID=35708 RepID=A0A0A9GMK9_ARUDO